VRQDRSRGAAPGGGPDVAALAERYRRELHVHCYRMLASYEDAEDAVQETFLRAWRARDTFDPRRPLRPWLYRIATNVCVDVLRRRSHPVTEASSFAEVPWLQPYPDRLLDEVAPSDDEPEAVAVERETIELAFLAALQALPPRQRAALIVRDMLGWPASETASLLGISVAAANSALQRARATMQERLPRRRADWAQGRPSAEEWALLERFIESFERGDALNAAALVTQDVRVTMPPYPWCYDGLDALSLLMDRAHHEGDWRLVPTWANRMPAAANYLRRPDDSRFQAFKLDVLRIERGLIAEITTFGPELFAAFGLGTEL